MRPLLASALVLLAVAPGAGAATLTVDSGADALADDGRCTLREALLATATDAARGGCPAGTGDGDVIVVAVPAVTLTQAGFYEDGGETGDLDVHGIVTIRGGGVTIDAAGLDRVLDVRPDGVLTLEDATLRGGVTPRGYDPSSPGTDGGGSAPGGGLRADGPTTLRRVAVVDNRTGDGGNGAGLSIGTSDANGGDGGDAGGGGGIAATAPLTLDRVTVARNRTGNGGAAGDGNGGTKPAFGGYGQGGAGGDGGSGGGVEVLGPATIADATIVDNATGDGATGGNGHGGAGPGASSGTAGSGGVGLGGRGGRGGHGGGLEVRTDAIVTISTSLLARNATGHGSAGGSGYGGGGANGTGTATGGKGGDGSGGTGGAGGSGGGLRAFGSAVRNVRLLASTVVANATGAGAAGGNAFGAPGGGGGAHPGGKGGDGVTGAGGDAGIGGGVVQPGGSALRVRGSTIARNTTSTAPGPAGSGAPGFGGNGAPPGADGSLFVASAGHPGLGAIASTDVEVSGSIVAENAPEQCQRLTAQPWFGGANVVWPAGGDACGVSQLVADPLLGAALGAHGGATATLALRAGSAALDAVPAGGGACDAADQRGVARPFGGACDAGAYERAAAGVVATAARAVSGTDATLDGTVDARRGATTVHAEWDGGRSADVVVGAGVDGAVPVSFAATGLKPGTTYTYTLVGVGDDGTARSAPATFTTAGTGGPGGGPGRVVKGSPPVVPRLTALKVSPAAPRRGAKVTLSWTDSAPATTTLAFARRTRGVRKGARCVAPPRKATKKKAKTCTRWIAVKGTLTHADVAGANKMVWNGRLGGKPLPAGGYRVTATPRLGGVTGNAVVKAFTVRAAARPR